MLLAIKYKLILSHATVDSSALCLREVGERTGLGREKVAGEEGLPRGD
jgi:hypothetical protein